MSVLSKSELKTLMGQHGEWCVSIFMPAHRAGR